MWQKIGKIQQELNVINKVYLSFLSYILKIMNTLNKTFQSESSQIIYFTSLVKEILTQIFCNFLKKDYINCTNICDIDYKNNIHIKDLINMYIGHEAEMLICSVNLTEIQIKAIKCNILTFYQSICDEILYRFDLNNKKLNYVKVLDPLYIKSSDDINYGDIVTEFKEIINNPEDFIYELKLLESKSNDKSYTKLFDITKVEEFWYKVGNLKNNLNEYMYPNLFQFAVYVLTLPHSSACAERVFSKLNLMKNKLTNRLKVQTCHSMLAALNLLDVDLENWKPNTDLIKKYIKEFRL